MTKCQQTIKYLETENARLKVEYQTAQEWCRDVLIGLRFPEEKPITAAQVIERFTDHQRKAGQSKSPKKLKALAKARKLAAKANRSKNPSPGALYQRKRRARIKAKS